MPARGELWSAIAEQHRSRLLIARLPGLDARDTSMGAESLVVQDLFDEVPLDRRQQMFSSPSVSLL